MGPFQLEGRRATIASMAGEANGIRGNRVTSRERRSIGKLAQDLLKTSLVAAR